MLMPKQADVFVAAFHAHGLYPKGPSVAALTTNVFLKDTSMLTAFRPFSCQKLAKVLLPFTRQIGAKV
jgi:hypothetical protein